jgi:hypothetical protein
LGVIRRVGIGLRNEIDQEVKRLGRVKVVAEGSIHAGLRLEQYLLQALVLLAPSFVLDRRTVRSFKFRLRNLKMNKNNTRI